MKKPKTLPGSRRPLRVSAILASAAAATLLLASKPANTQTPSEPVPGINPDKSLSEQLDDDKGVIEPPPVGDAGIHVPAPDPTPNTTPVIPPPGTDEGDPTVIPK